MDVMLQINWRDLNPNTHYTRGCGIKILPPKWDTTKTRWGSSPVVVKQFPNLTQRFCSAKMYWYWPLTKGMGCRKKTHLIKQLMDELFDKCATQMTPDAVFSQKYNKTDLYPCTQVALVCNTHKATDVASEMIQWIAQAFMEFLQSHTHLSILIWCVELRLKDTRWGTCS